MSTNPRHHPRLVAFFITLVLGLLAALQLWLNAAMEGTVRTSLILERDIRTAGHVGIRGRVEEDALMIEIADDGPGPGASPQRGEGLGLANVASRLSTRHGAAGHFELVTASEGGCIARIRIPWRVELAELEADA